MTSICRNLLIKYNLPTAYELLKDTPTKKKWRAMLREAVNNVVESEWQNNISEKPSLKYLNQESLKVGHPIYSTVR